jgi:GNAT superfamily N-acetyltransferase
MKDAPSVENLLTEWFHLGPADGRLESVRSAVEEQELLVAEIAERIIGFIHYVMHDDIIDGGPNSFITAFYVSPANRGQGVGTSLLESAIADALQRGAVGVETSTIHVRAKRFYEKHHFRQAVGDISEVFLELDISEYLRAKNTSS